MGEIPATTYTPPTIFPGFKVEPGFGYDPRRARELLGQSGKVKGGTLPGVKLLYRPGAPAAAAYCQNIVNQWRSNLGIDIQLELVETKIARQRLNDKDYSIATGNWIGDYQDPSTFTDKYLSNSVNNDSDWQNPQFDGLCAQATREADPVKRYHLLEQANRLIDVELPVIPLYYITNQYLFRDTVHGINQNPRNMTMFKGVYVEREKR